MGIDVYSLDFLTGFRDHAFGRTLMLGRQGLHVERDDPIGVNIIARRGVCERLQDLAGADNYCEPLFRLLGATDVSSMDMSAFEGADIVHDLNRPVDDVFHEAFDTIFDGGTLEHVFDFPAAIANVKSMLRVGGLFLAATTANNFLGHGFYQFSPELMWRVFGSGSGFEVVKMLLCEATGMPTMVEAPDPAALQRRVEIMVTKAPTYLMVAARKLAHTSLPRKLQQSDYESQWREAAERR